MAFDFQPTLTGALVELRPLRAEDADDLFAVASDPLIWEQLPARERHKPEVFAAFFRDALASGGALTALDHKDGRIVGSRVDDSQIGGSGIIGSSRYHSYNADASEIEIGFTFLARSHWGGQYNGEMKRLMLRHAFRFVKRVVFLVGPQNLRSQKAVEKLGGVRDGWRVDAAGRDAYLYVIRAEDWEPASMGDSEHGR
jgi:N-acetyltransferase